MHKTEIRSLWKRTPVLGPVMLVLLINFVLHQVSRLSTRSLWNQSNNGIKIRYHLVRFCTKKSNQMIKTTLYNQKLIHEKYENLKVDSDTIKKKPAAPRLTQQILVFI